jgi:hypothetical protein
MPTEDQLKANLAVPSAEEALQRVRWAETEKRRALNQVLTISPLPLAAVANNPSVLTGAGNAARVEEAASDVLAAHRTRAEQQAARNAIVSPQATARYNDVARAASDADVPRWQDWGPVPNVNAVPPANPRIPVPLYDRRTGRLLPYEDGIQVIDSFAPPPEGLVHQQAGQKVAADVGKEIRAQAALAEFEAAGEAANFAGRALNTVKGVGQTASRFAAGMTPALAIAERMSSYGDFMSSLSYLSALNRGPLERLDRSAEATLSADPAKLERALQEGLIARSLYDRLSAVPGS